MWQCSCRVVAVSSSAARSAGQPAGHAEAASGSLTDDRRGGVEGGGRMEEEHLHFPVYLVVLAWHVLSGNSGQEGDGGEGR